MDKEKIIKLLKEEDEQHFNIEEVDEKDLPLVSVIMPVYNAEMRSAYQQIIAAYMQGQLTLDELVAGLTEKAEMMLR